MGGDSSNTRSGWWRRPKTATRALAGEEYPAGTSSSEMDSVEGTLMNSPAKAPAVRASTTLVDCVR